MSDLDTDLRQFPPMSVVTKKQLKMYHTLHDDITNNGTIMQFNDRYALGELAVTLVEINDCRDDIALNGVMLEMKGDKGSSIQKRNPYADILEKRLVHLKALFKEFKLTPQSRGKITTGAGVKKESDGWDEI